MLNDKAQSWIQEVYDKIIDKETRVIKKLGVKIPYTSTTDESGIHYNDMLSEDPRWWTNGFWEGILWLIYNETKDAEILDIANQIEDRMDPVLYGVEGLHHDVGFMWHLSSVANYRLTGNEKARTRGLLAANYLASRFTPMGGFITAWNDKEREGWSIIDTMMNLPLLYWATEESKYDRFRQVAQLHADKTIENVVRPDGSVVHIIEYDPVDGSVVQTFGGQGYAVGSSWTRGQSWAIYGFTLSYTHTGEQRYLDAAKRVAHYFLAAVAEYGYIPPIDFRSPAEPAYVDSTAGAIAACGLIELSKQVPEYEKALYLNGAIRLLKALEAKHVDWSDSSEPLLHCGSEAYDTRRHLDIVYGDYFFIEAVLKLKGQDFNMW